MQLEIEFGYENLDAVMRIIDQNRLDVLSREMGLRGLIRVGVDRAEAGSLSDRFEALPGVRVR